VIEPGEAADREAHLALEVLFDVFGYRGVVYLQTSLTF